MSESKRSKVGNFILGLMAGLMVVTGIFAVGVLYYVIMTAQAPLEIWQRWALLAVAILMPTALTIVAARLNRARMPKPSPEDLTPKDVAAFTRRIEFYGVSLCYGKATKVSGGFVIPLSVGPNWSIQPTNIQYAFINAIQTFYSREVLDVLAAVIWDSFPDEDLGSYGVDINYDDLIAFGEQGIAFVYPENFEGPKGRLRAKRKLRLH